MQAQTHGKPRVCKTRHPDTLRQLLGAINEGSQRASGGALILQHLAKVEMPLWSISYGLNLEGVVLCGSGSG